MKKEIAEAGSGPTTGEISDKLETSPVTEKAAETLDELKDKVEAIKEDK